MDELINKITSWEFMGERGYNWFLLIGVLVLSLIAWKFITDYID